MSQSMEKREPNSVENVNERPAVAPRVDVYENQEEYLVVADLPGVTSEALKLNVDDDELVLDAARTSAFEGTPVAREFRTVDFRRSFKLPQGVDREKIDAELKAGVLRLRLPKAESLKPRQIAVRAG